MKLLIYGAGVIGSLYAAAFAEAGYDTTVYARGKKLETLKTRGLLYEKNGKQYKAKVKVIATLQNDDIYDFIFLTVKENQVHTALEELRPNGSPNIVTMVNTLEPYADWENLCGEGRIIPAFPGAGGSYEDGVLKADFTPPLIQATTFAEIGGNTSERLKKLAALFKTAGVPYPRKSILLKTADNKGMDLENIFDYFNDIKIISNHDGYFYSVNEALKILLLGLLCGRKNIREIHEWATADIIKDRLNKEFGIKKTPCYYWLTCLLKLINIDSLNECFMNMAEALIKEYGTEKPLTIAIDGKTIRSTDKMSSYESPLHIVSAQVAEFGITLAQKCVKGKTNEIPTVQSLIKTLNIKGHIIVTDALNCQKETAKIIKEGKGDYLLSVKGNQPLLKADIEEYVQDEILRKQMDTACKSEKNRERVEKRTAFCTTNLGWMDNTGEWEGLSCIGAIHSEFKSKKGKSDEWHYYISSRKLTAQELLDIARKEWVVETMHWLLDVHFREDFCRLLDKNLQQALNIGRKVALNLVSRYKQKNAPKSSLSHIMFKALMDISFIKKYYKIDFHVPYRIVKDMHGWQLYHLALVVPIADAYYKAKNPEEVWKEADIMNDTARQIKNNFQKLYRSGVKLSPPKMHLLRLLPAPILQAIFTQVFKSRFGNLFMYRHSMKAPDEMRSLHSQLYQYLAAIPTNHNQRGMKLICVGDSLTFGNVGYSYIHFLNKKIHAVNKGKNGDTLRGAYGRLKKIIDKSRHGGGTFILGIGTNDILLPYLKSLSLFWFLTMNLRCKIKRCIENDDIFEREYDRLLHLCSEKNKRVIVFGMPFINLKNFPHEKTVRRNAVIKRLAQKYNYSFIDIYDLQKETLLPDKRTYTWKYGFAFRLIDAVIMTLLPFCKDRFAKARGLNASVDGVHFNSASAKILAAEIEKAALR